MWTTIASSSCSDDEAQELDKEVFSSSTHGEDLAVLGSVVMDEEGQTGTSAGPDPMARQDACN